MCILAVYYAVVYINDSILSIQIYTDQSGWVPLHTKQKQLFFEADETDAELRPLGQYSIRGKKKREKKTVFCAQSFKMYQASNEK